MLLEVIIWTASILKVVDPGEILYIHRDPSCQLEDGQIELTIVEELPEDPAAEVGWLEQNGQTCDVYEVTREGS